jgi:hypothetical protein
LIVQSCFYTLAYRKKEKWKITTLYRKKKQCRTIDSPVMFIHYHTEIRKNEKQLSVQSLFYTLPYRKKKQWRTIDSPVMFIHSTIQKDGKMKNNCQSSHVSTLCLTDRSGQTSTTYFYIESRVQI